MSEGGGPAAGPFRLLWVRLPSSVAVGCAISVDFEIQDHKLSNLVKEEAHRDELLACRWMISRGGRTVQMEATGRTYVPTADDAGASITVYCSVRNPAPGYEGEKVARVQRVVEAPKRRVVRPFVHRRGLGFKQLFDLLPRSFRVCTYNTLAPRYCSPSSYPHAEVWTLQWSFRVRLVLEDLDFYCPDIVCLQEVSKSGFTNDLEPALQERGYDGLFKQRTKDEHMDDPAMDGCALFFNRSRFKLRKVYDVEFSQLARHDSSIGTSRPILNHFYKHNVAQIVFLECLAGEQFPVKSPSHQHHHSGDSPAGFEEESGGSSSSAPRGAAGRRKQPGLGVDKMPAGSKVDGELWVDARDRFRVVDRLFDTNKLQNLLKDPEGCTSDMEGYLSEDSWATVPPSDEGPGEENPVICVCNTHVLSNMRLADVKLWQACVLVEKINQACSTFVNSVTTQTGAPPSSPPAVLLCGDFNSHPDTGLYEFLLKGADFLRSPHKDVLALQERLPEFALQHHIHLGSAMLDVLGHEPAFTNFNNGWNGCLDYIWFERSRFQCLGVLEELRSLEDMCSEQHGGPNTNFPSDHIPLVAEFVLMPGSG